MATMIIMTVDGGLSTQEVQDLRYLLSDALGDFAVKRSDEVKYVDARYPGPDYYPDRDNKIEQVRRRIQLARKMHNVVLGFVVSSEHDHKNHTCPDTDPNILCPDPYASECPKWEALRKGHSERYVQAVLHESLHAGLERQTAALTCLQQLFGMTEEEARASYNQLEDKRITKLLVEQGLVTS